MQVGALLGISSPTFFINAGVRHNEGDCGLGGSEVQEGGKDGEPHMIVSAKLNRREFGYGVEGAEHNPIAAANLQFFAALYSQPSPSASRFYFLSYEEAATDKSGKFHRLANGSFFNITAYKAQIRVSIECLLVEANARAQEALRVARACTPGLQLLRSLSLSRPSAASVRVSAVSRPSLSWGNSFKQISPF